MLGGWVHPPLCMLAACNIRLYVRISKQESGAHAHPHFHLIHSPRAPRAAIFKVSHAQKITLFHIVARRRSLGRTGCEKWDWRRERATHGRGGAQIYSNAAIPNRRERICTRCAQQRQNDNLWLCVFKISACCIDDSELRGHVAAEAAVQLPWPGMWILVTPLALLS